MADHNRRLRELVTSDDTALVLQGIELLASLERADPYRRLLAGARLDAEGTLTPADGLSVFATLCLLADAPDDTVPRELQRAHIERLTLRIERLPERIGRFSALTRMKVVLYGDQPLTEAIGQLSRLTELSIHCRRLSALPLSAEGNPRLRVLSINAPLTTLPILPHLQRLTLRGPALTALPEELEALTALHTLEILNASSLTALPEAIGSLAALRELSITASALSGLPDAISGLTALHTLRLSENTDLVLRPGQLAPLAALETLELAGTGVHRLPPELVDLDNLKRLTLSGHVTHEHILDRARGETWGAVDVAIDAMALLAERAPRNLASLLRGGELLPSDRLIRGYRFAGSPQAGLDDAWLAGLALLPPEHSPRLNTQLTRLDLSGGLLPNPHVGDLLGNPRPVALSDPLPLLRLLLTPPPPGPAVRPHDGLHRIPPNLDRFSRLERLDLSHNRIIELSRPLPARLKWLSLADNPLLSFPTRLLSMSRLRALSLERTTLTALPEAGWKSSRLVELSLSGNALEDLPEALARLRSLTTLSLADNRLHTLPDLSRLTRLTTLDLSGNRLSHLPDWLGTLPLTELDASGNRICSLPDALTGWGGLKTLNLADNGLLILPPVDRLGRLTLLDLSGNDLRQLPDELAGMEALTELRLPGNALTRVPESLWHLPALATVDLSDNQLCELSWAMRTAPVLRSLDVSGNPLPAAPMLRWMLRRRLGDGLQITGDTEDQGV